MRLDKILGLVGALIWSATIFLRETALMNHDVLRLLLGVAPNFGAVWLAYFLIPLIYPLLGNRFTFFSNRYILTAVILLLLLLSEIIHDLFLNAPFDPWDIAASVIAALLWLSIKYGIDIASKTKNHKA